MPGLASAWTRLGGPLREFGWGNGLLYIVDRILRSLSPQLGLRVYELVAQPVTSKPLLPASLSRHYTFAEIGPGHPDIEQMPARPDIKAQRFEQGARCLGAYKHGELVGFAWFCSARYHEDEARCTYELAQPACSVFDFDVYVMPAYRMGAGFAALWQGANAYLAQQGIGWTFSRVTRFNLASRRAHARLGAHVVGRAWFLQAWRVELMLSTLRPFVALTWRPAQRVRLRLAPAAASDSTPVTPAQPRSNPSR